MELPRDVQLRILAHADMDTRRRLGIFLPRPRVLHSGGMARAYVSFPQNLTLSQTADECIVPPRNGKVPVYEIVRCLSADGGLSSERVTFTSAWTVDPVEGRGYARRTHHAVGGDWYDIGWVA